MVSLVYSTCLKLVVMTVLLMITCGQVSPSPPFVVLGSTSNTRACVGVQISPLHVLLLSKCVDRNDALTKASTLVIPTNSSSSTTGLTKEEAILQSHVAIIDATSLQLETPSKDSLHAVTLAKPLSSSAVILPLQSEIPELDSNATLVSLDLTAMEVSWAREVVYVDGSLCKHSACVLPVDVEAREMLSEPNKWSFLVRQAKNEDQVSLLGLGGHLVTNEDGIWGFSWLPKLLTSSTFLDNGIQGVHTVQTVKKEIVGGRVIEKMDKYTEFIVGLRISEKATSNCTGSLIASRFVLTAAGCWRPLYQFKWAVFNTVATSGKPSEVIAIKQLTRYDSFRAGILGNNVMLIELENASSRRPIAYVSKNDATKMPATITAFDYGAYRKLFVGHWSTILRYKKFKVYNNSDCPADVQRRLDKITVCALDGLCYGDFGSPMVLDAGTDKQKLFAVSGMRSTVLPPVCRSQPSGSAT